MNALEQTAAVKKSWGLMLDGWAVGGGPGRSSETIFAKSPLASARRFHGR
jgi:hypothetical protein